MDMQNGKKTAYLCGGTFFNILLLARKPRLKARQHGQGLSDNLKDMDVMRGLITVVTGNELKVDTSSIRISTSRYKECLISGDTYIPFNDKVAVDNFDFLINRNYTKLVDRMIDFTDEFIDLNKKEWLVKALLELIENDSEIEDDDRFFFDEDGYSLTEIREMNQFDLQPFLVGILHYVLVNRKDNTKGLSTLESWGEKKPHAERDIRKHPFGTAIKRDITVDEYIRSDRIDPEGINDETIALSTEPILKYLQRAHSYYSSLKTLLYSDYPRDFDDFYVCNDISGSFIGRKEKENKIENATVKELSKYTNFMVITGTGGIGKTMMLKHLFLEAAESYTENKVLPIIYPLKKYSDSKGLFVRLLKEVQQFCGEFDGDALFALLEKGRCAILLDGMDEIPESVREHFEEELNDFSRSYPDNIYIMSSRPTSNFFTYTRFSMFEIQPFTKKQAIQMVKNLEYDQDVKDAFLKELEYGDLYLTHKEFAGNPLLLTIMLMTYSYYGEIPAKMHVFYSQAYETLARVHDASKGSFSRKLHTGLTPDVFKVYFAEFCARSYMNDMLEFSKKSFCKIMTAVIRHKGKELSCTAEDFLQDLTDNICIMFKEGGSYFFLHRSFQEYFSAVYFASQMDDQLYTVAEMLEDKSAQHYADSTFDMMYDMIPERMERYMFIPYLKDILESESEDQYHEFLQAIYPSLTICVGTRKDAFGTAQDLFVYSKIQEIADIDESRYLSDEPWPETILQFKQREYTAFEEIKDESVIEPGLRHPGKLIAIRDLPDEYITLYGTPKSHMTVCYLSLYSVFDEPDKYSDILKVIDAEDFPLRVEYEEMREYLAGLEKKYLTKPSDPDDWFANLQ